jgi:3-hydroxyisobutyrate dehydrogenase-like beta-hydroxyacid dehydrogenase
MSNPTPVTVIGTGTMGSALARALLRAGHTVTVWNRTAARAAPLAEEGANVAANLQEAVTASEFVIICVASPDVVDELVSAASAELRGRTLVQVTTGRPAAIRRGAAVATAAGITVLGGAILAYPRTVGLPEAVFLFGGEEAEFEHARPLLEDLGTVHRLGPDPGAPSAMDAALIGFFYGALSGFLHGARITKAEGMELKTYSSLAQPFIGNFISGAIADAAERVVSRDYSDPQSSLDTHLGGIDDLVVGTSHDAGLDSPVMEAIRDQIAAGVQRGLGSQDIAVLLEP